MPPRKKELTEEEKEAKRLARNAYMRAYYAKNKAKKTTGPEPTGPSKAVEALKELRAEPKTGFVAKEEKLATKGGFKPRAKKAEAPGTSKLPPITKTTAKKATLKKLTKEEQAKRDAEEAEAKARREAADAEARQKEAETRARVLAEGKKAAEAVRPVPPPAPAPAPKTTMTEGQARVETLASELPPLVRVKAAPKKLSSKQEAKRQEGIKALEEKIVEAGKSTYGISEASHRYFQKEAAKLGLKPKQFVGDVLAARKPLGNLTWKPGDTQPTPDPEMDERIRQARARLTAAGGGAMLRMMTGFA